MSRLLAVDAATLYFRAFHGIPNTVTAPDGTPINAVRGYLDMTSQLMTRFSPAAYAACWDEDWRPAFRTDLVPSYKAHRVAVPVDGPTPDQEEVPDELAGQVPLLRQTLGLLGLTVVGAPGHEADDVCATLVTRWPTSDPAGGDGVDVVSGDRDLLQLVDDGSQTRVVYIGGGLADAPVFDQEHLQATYGVVDGAAYLDMSVLRGDPSDGLPGVPGIGEKTAADLLRRHGDLDGVLAASAGQGSGLSPARRARLLETADYIARARQVVTCVRDAPLEPDDLAALLLGAEPDPAATDAHAEQWGLTNAVARLRKALGRNRPDRA